MQFQHKFVPQINHHRRPVYLVLKCGRRMIHGADDLRSAASLVVNPEHQSRLRKLADALEQSAETFRGIVGLIQHEEVHQ